MKKMFFMKKHVFHEKHEKHEKQSHEKHVIVFHEIT